MRGFNEEREAPVREGDELDVVIDAVGEKGDGIARVHGFVLIVPGAKQGERLHIKISRVLKSVAFTEVVGPAKSEPKQQAKPKHEAPKEDEFDPEEHKDSYDFGDEEDADRE
ncbi:MAG: TRAM domain-containing protein [Nitrosarchaeum sp.]|nr:TRAM domain-containing protein [Nitrosarchaeum sp.]